MRIFVYFSLYLLEAQKDNFLFQRLLQGSLNKIMQALQSIKLFETFIHSHLASSYTRLTIKKLKNLKINH